MNTLKKVQDKVLFVSSLEIDNIGSCESINLDSKGFFLFDMSQQPAEPLVSGIPLYLDNSSVKEQKLMPVVLLVPSCRGTYSNSQQGISFISIVKTIMCMTFLSQGRANKSVSTEFQQAVLSVKEWDVGLQKGFLSFRILNASNRADEAAGDDPKVISYNKQTRTYSSSAHRQNSLENQAKRSTSSQSDENDA